MTDLIKDFNKTIFCLPCIKGVEIAHTVWAIHRLVKRLKLKMSAFKKKQIMFDERFIALAKNCQTKYIVFKKPIKFEVKRINKNTFYTIFSYFIAKKD